MKDISWLNDLKLRVSYGKLGSLAGVETRLSNAYDLYKQSNGNANYDINGTGNSTVTGLYRFQAGNTQTSWENDIIKTLVLI